LAGRWELTEEQWELVESILLPVRRKDILRERKGSMLSSLDLFFFLEMRVRSGMAGYLPAREQLRFGLTVTSSGKLARVRFQKDLFFRELIQVRRILKILGLGHH
jgi:hypothetical protein